MQGYPINEYSTNNYYSYSNDSICNDSICSVNTLMENLGNIEGISWIQIISIKEKIINQLTENIKPQSTEITETTEKIDKAGNKLESDKFKTSRIKHETDYKRYSK